MRKNTETDFWARVDKISDPQGCWLWTGQIRSDGYGVIKWCNKYKTVHRLAYILTGHTIPEGLVLRHSEYCVGKRHCCNPDHLTPGTHSDNNLDMHRDGTMPCKLTAEQVLDIRARVGQTQKEIADHFGIEHTTIYKIIHRKRWKHI
jgi:hypothetical protein